MTMSPDTTGRREQRLMHLRDAFSGVAACGTLRRGPTLSRESFLAWSDAWHATEGNDAAPPCLECLALAERGAR